MKETIDKIKSFLSNNIVKNIVLLCGGISIIVAGVFASQDNSEIGIALAIIGGSIILLYFFLFVLFYIFASILDSDNKKKTVRDLYCAFAILIGPPAALAGIILLFDKNIEAGFKVAALLLGIVLSASGLFLYFKHYKDK